MIRALMIRALMLAALLAAAWRPAAAQQVLYTPVPPKGSAYIRFANGLDGPARLAPDFLPAQLLGANGADRVTPYAVVQNVQGRTLGLRIRNGLRVRYASFSVPPGGFVTVILAPFGATGIAATPVTDKTAFNQTRAHLAFYNATPACPAASVKLLPSEATVFDAVPPGAAATRSVNPVQATVVAACGMLQAPPVALDQLQAGGMYSLWLIAPKLGQTLSFLSHDSTLPWQP
jgi:hypothetical protein